MTPIMTRRSRVLEILYQARIRALEGIRVANPALGRDIRLVNLSRTEGKSVKEAVELMNWIRMMKQYRGNPPVTNTPHGFWKDTRNHKKFADWLSTQSNF